MHGGNKKYEKGSGILHCEVLDIAGQEWDTVAG
jgi:hypothetical protein